MIIKNYQYLSQRDNIDIDLETFIRKQNTSTQCMVSSFAMWILQFGHFIQYDKWIRQWNPKTAEEILYILIMNKVRELNLEEEEKTIKDKNYKKLHYSRFMSEVFRRVIDPMIGPLGWKMQVKQNNIDVLADILDTGQGVVVGTNISSYLPKATGHIQYFIGYEKDKEGRVTGFYSCDPYGDCRTGYKVRTLEKGYVFYEIEHIKRLLQEFGKGCPTLCSYAVRGE